MLIVGIPAGVLADIVDRRKLLLVTQASMMVAALLLTVLAFADKVTPVSLLALTFALGLGTGLNGPAWQAIQPDLVPKRELSQALASAPSRTTSGGRSVPALGGLVLAVVGAAVGVRHQRRLVPRHGARVEPAGAPPDSTLAAPGRDADQARRVRGLRYGLYSPVLRAVLLRVAVLMFPAAAIQALLPDRRARLARAELGAMTACCSHASGSVPRSPRSSVPRLEQHLTRDQLVVRSSVLLGLGILVDGLVGSAWIVGVGLFVAGMGWTTVFTTTNVSAQSTLPAWVRARGMGLYMLVLTGCVALGSATWGLLADASLVGGAPGGGGAARCRDPRRRALLPARRDARPSTPRRCPASTRP